VGRTRVCALALVNWKGVFYERYLLDRHVTALEGANGAGKTTVMIGAYVVLLPDMSRLRFTNLGESGAIGGDRGIWGRLGEAGRPAYAALDLELPEGERLVAGVRLARKGEPTVELTPFTVSGLAAETALQDLLLVRDGDSDSVPALDEVRSNASRLGGELTVYRSTRDYFAALFELGATPLRLTGDEDRRKLNDMLRTSMTGGISRALTSELRGFLLKQESGLADTLGRVRANLSACARTRSEVAEARVLERDISGVYEAGREMFAASVLAVRRAADEHRAALATARTAADAAERERVEFARKLERDLARRDEVSRRLADARAAAERMAQRRENRRQLKEAEERIAELDAELATLTADAASAQAALADADAVREQRRRADADARDAYDRAAQGLARTQDGLDELHRRAYAHRRARDRWTELERALERPETASEGALENLPEFLPGFLPGFLEDQARALTARGGVVDSERARLSREIEAHQHRRDDYERATAALAELESALDEPGDQGDTPLARGRSALAEFDRREALLGRGEELARELAEAQRAAERQALARTRADALGLDAQGAAGREEQLAERVRTAERAQAEAEAKERHHREQAELHGRTAALAVERHGALEQRASRWARCAGAAGRLTQALGAEAVATESLPSLEQRLAEQYAAAQASRHETIGERERVLQQAAELEAAGGAVAENVLELRDELGGELVVGRYEELEVDDAARTEALLGPLALAIVVPDPELAAQQLAEREGPLPEVRLMAPGVSVEPDGEAAFEGRAVIVREQGGIRITPLPDAPTLGRHARARRAAELRDRAEGCGEELDRLLAELHRLDGLRRDAASVADNLEVFVAGDPNSELEALSQSAETARRSSDEHASLAEASARAAAEARRELDALRALVPDALLLGPPDYAERCAALGRSVDQLRNAERDLAGVAAPRRILAEYLEALRTPPAASVDHLARELAELDDERDRIFGLREAIDELGAQIPALGWTDAEAALSNATNLIPALEHQHQAARDAARDAARVLAEADAVCERAAAAWRAADSARAATDAMRQRHATERAELLERIGVSDPGSLASLADDGALVFEDEQPGDLEGRAASLEGELLELVETCARETERSVRAQERAELAGQNVANAELAAAPAEAGWKELREASEQRGLDVPASEVAERAIRATAAELAADAEGKLALTIDRAQRARGGHALAEALTDTLAPAHERTADGLVVDRWQRVRAWIGQRVPAQVAQVDDPLLALEQLRDHLSVLEARLERQEADLRSASADISRGIEVQLRRAAWQVRRLNQHLEGISFGSVSAIRVQLQRIERMDQILAALRDGATQELLFQAALPVEEALDEIFSRYSGGRGGGQRLLDYREYVALQVEIQRRGGDEWEQASPTRLSTGEAIGVGAALMMVVLTEWERDANLLRSRRTGGSLRFLFLDEANRLSRDNLGVLFELCRTLDLQLIIAAPEVAQAEGNTTYRLVRRMGDNGREEVLVSGRRSVSDPAA